MAPLKRFKNSSSSLTNPLYPQPRFLSLEKAIPANSVNRTGLVAFVTPSSNKTFGPVKIVLFEFIYSLSKLL